MGYDRKVIAAAEEELAARRKKALDGAEERKKEIDSLLPEAAKIDREIALTGRRMISAGEEQKRRLRAEMLDLRAKKRELMVGRGFKGDYLEPQYSCSLCKDSGLVDGMRCRCMSALLKKKAFELSNLGSSFGRMTFDNFDLGMYPAEKKIGGRSYREHMELVLKQCKKFAERFEKQTKGLLFCGGTGLGKTHLASAVARAVNDRGCAVVYETAPALFTAFEDKKFGRAKDGGEQVETYLSCELLILDDLGSEIKSELNQSNLLYLINHRGIHGLRTIVTTNLSPEELKGRYDGRIFSRLVGEFAMLLFVGDDLRAKKLRE